MTLDQILKTAEFVFKDVPDATDVINYIKALEEVARARTPKPTQNALVQINSPDVKVFSPQQTLIDNKKLDTLTIDSNTLAEVRKRLGIAASEDVLSAIDKLKEQKAEPKCQLDEKGKCTFCEKRFLLTTECVVKKNV